LAAIALLVLGILAFTTANGGGGSPSAALGGNAPAFAGLSRADAQALANERGLKAEFREAATYDTPAGIVVTQSQSGSNVSLVVSSGVIVPDLIGRPCPEARETEGRGGWAVKAVRWRFANQPDFGKVVEQQPAAGAVIPNKGDITVQVAGPVAPC
jgi:beta-lactam-binding protein with PASTA domain